MPIAALAETNISGELTDAKPAYREMPSDD